MYEHRVTHVGNSKSNHVGAQGASKSRCQEEGPNYTRRVRITNARSAIKCVVWPLHDIVITNRVWCMIIQKGGRAGVLYCPTVVQQYCNSVANAGGRRGIRMFDCAQKPQSKRIIL